MANKKMNLDGKHEKVISYNGEVITFQLSTVKAASGGTEKASLCFYRRTFQILSGQFVENFTGQYNFSSSYSVIEFVCVNCVGDTRTGLTLPCVLLRHGKKKKSAVAKCHLFMLHSSNDLECRLKWKVDFETVHDLQMCDGPTVVWRHHNQLFYVSPQTSGILNASINISSIHWAGELKPKGILILGITDDSFQESGDVGENVINHPEKQFIAYSTEEQKTMPGSCFLPSAYSSVVRCLQVCTMHIKNDKYETSVVAASSKQLIWFHNGVPREVCQLPFENPFKLHVAFTSRGDLLFIVSFISGDVCAIWKDSWQIAATWHHVRSILVDDFIGTGSDQLLLLFNNIPDMSADQQRFQITDCGEINYPSNLYNEKEGSSAEEGYHENCFRIIQALETRLQAGLRSVQEMQQHLQVKERVLKSSCETLFDMLQGKETILHCAEEEGLVSLWDDSLHISCPSESEATSLSPDSECFVEKIWHRVVDNFFVIGVKLYPSIYLSLSNVALSLLMDEEITSLSPVTKCQTNVLNMAIRSLFDYNASYQTEPVAKKQRLDSHNKDNLSRDSTERPCSSSYQNDLEHTVTAVTELSPLLALNNTSCVLLLHARRENQPDSILKREKLTVPCGRISLSLEEVLKGNHTVNVFEHCQGDVNLENVLALLSVYEKRSFRIWSPDYTLASVKSWLLGPMQGKPIKQLPDLIFSCLPGSLHGTLFIWIPGNPCEGTLTIFYRTEPGLLQCLYSLKCVLPPTCVVNTISVGGKYCLTENLAQSMEEELLALRGSASAAASDVEKEMKQRCIMKTKTSNTIGPLSDTKERVQKYREELQIEQKQSKLGVPLTTSCNMYRHIAFNVAEIQMKTDTIAFKLSQS